MNVHHPLPRRATRRTNAALARPRLDARLDQGWGEGGKMCERETFCWYGPDGAAVAFAAISIFAITVRCSTCVHSQAFIHAGLLAEPIFGGLPHRLRNAGAAKRQSDATVCEIDQLVYQLYGLTDKEIALVEEATRG